MEGPPFWGFVKSHHHQREKFLDDKPGKEKPSPSFRSGERKGGRGFSWGIGFSVALFLMLADLAAATLTFSTSAPSAATNAISNFVGAGFDADNVGGSGVNANGGSNNGAANDGTTYVAHDRPAQGQTFTTGTNAGGYTMSSITVQMQGYTNNVASGGNVGGYSLANTNSTFVVRVGRITNTASNSLFIPYSVEYAASGGTNTPGTGGSANGPETYLTFTFKAPIVLKPSTVYAFDIGTPGDYFEMQGIRNGAANGNPYSAGTAYTSGSNGVAAGTITPQAGDRVFQINLTAYAVPVPGTFVHPGLLNTEADFERMRVNVALGVDPWISNYNALKGSWMAQTGGWNPNAQATITRSGALNDSSRLYNDITVAYSSALMWKITGDTRYADQAVTILNAWGYLFTSVTGDTNAALTELYGCQFAAVAEIMRTYPGWASADIAQFQSMIYSVFYPLANSFLTGHFGTADDHYWMNWDLASMSTMYAIGVLNDNTNLTTQAITYFYNGVGNGCIDRAVNFIHPGLLGQGQEIGRDQGHASLDVAQLAGFCQMAWNQGVDLFSYENNRVLSLVEYTAKYNLWQDTPFTPYYSSTGGRMTVPGSGSRGATGRPGWATFYNHYVNILGLAAPYTQTVVNQNGTSWSWNGDTPGWDALTTALTPIASGANPSGLSGTINGQQPQLSWWGSAYATGYNMKRSTVSGGPYTNIATGLTNTTYVDTNPVSGVTNYYVVTASLSGGAETGASQQTSVGLGSPIYAQLLFNETNGTTAADATGDGWNGTLVNGASWATGKNGNAVSLASASSNYVTLPTGVGSTLSDFSISAWVYQNSAVNWARIFDFGSGDGQYGGVDPWGNHLWIAERNMLLAPQNGSGKLRFAMTRSGGGGEEDLDAPSALPVGQWVHVAVTKSGIVATLYTNGVAVAQNLNMPMAPFQLPATMSNNLGKSQYRGDPYFNGKIDDFRIYNGALSTAQVYTLATGLAPASLPVAPATLTVTAQPAQNLLNWSAVSNATSYTILRATTSSGPYTAIASLVSGTTYTDTTGIAGVTYYYEVEGADTGGTGAVSSSTSVVALPPIPSAPTSLSALSISASSIALSWTAGANNVTYNVKRSLVSGGPYTNIATGVTNAAYTDTGLTAGVTYYYVVSGVNASGEGAVSNEDNATPSDLHVWLKFDESTGSTNATDSSSNGWTATLLNGPSFTNGLMSNAISLASASTNYATLPTGVVSGLTNCTISTWVHLSSLANWQRIFDFGTGTANYMYLSPESGSGGLRFAIMVNGSAEQQINNASPLATNAWVHVAVSISNSTTVGNYIGTLYVNGIAVGTNAAMTFSPASLGSTTLNYIGKSQFNDPYLNGLVDDFRIYAHALTPAEIAALAAGVLPAPQNLTATGGLSQVALSWNAVTGAASYSVMRSLVSGGPYTNVATGVTNTTYTNTGLTPGSTYYYVIAATNLVGTGTNSAEVSATTQLIQSITFPALAAQTYRSAGTVALSATASSGLTVSYASGATNLVSVNSNVATLLGAGTATIVASQGGNATYTPAIPVTNTLVIIKAANLIGSFAGLPAQLVYTNNASLTISVPSASSGLPVTLSVAGVGILMGSNLLTLSGVGAITLMADQAGNSNYFAAATLSTNLSVVSGLSNSFAGVAGTNLSQEGMPSLLKYALGGDTNAFNSVLIPVPGSGSGSLTLDYLARTNDPLLSIAPESSVTTLSVTNAWSTNGVSLSVLGATNINGVPLERRRASVPQPGSGPIFLRLRANYRQ